MLRLPFPFFIGVAFAATFLTSCIIADEPAMASASMSAAETVLVAGATGRTGKEVVKHLLTQGKTVRVLARNRDKAVELFGTDVSIYVADIKNPADVDTAVAGVDDIISAIGSLSPEGPNRPEFVDYGGVKNLVDAAVKHGVDQFVLISSLGVTNKNHPLNAAVGNVMIWKLKGEDYLRASSVDSTIVRPGGLRDEPGRQQALQFDQGDRIKFGFIPRDDVAEISVAALQSRSARNVTFEVVTSKGSSDRNWNELFGGMQVDE